MQAEGGYRLVLIEWEDSAQPLAGWRMLDDFDDLAVIRVQSVGWLVHDGDAVKALAPNLGGSKEDDNLQACGIIRIPSRCVIRIADIGALVDHEPPPGDAQRA